MRDQFEKIDKDNTGLIDVKNLVDIVKAHFSRREADKIITELDTSGNHKINYTEFIAATMKVVEYIEKEEGQQKVDAIFEMFDTDHSGKLDSNNIKKAMEKLNNTISDQEILETMAKYDINNDGLIDRKEFDNFFLCESPTKRNRIRPYES